MLRFPFFVSPQQQNTEKYEDSKFENGDKVEIPMCESHIRKTTSHSFRNCCKGFRKPSKNTLNDERKCNVPRILYQKEILKVLH